MSAPFSPLIAETEMTAEHCALARSLLERVGRNELAAAYLWSAGVTFGPSVDDKLLLAAHVAEELRHFERSAALYERLGGADLLARVGPRARALAAPESWLELAVALFLFDRACCLEVRDQCTSRLRPLARLAEVMLDDEEGHYRAGETALEDACAASGADRARAQAHFDRWVAITLRALGTGDAQERRAVELGVRPRTAAELARDWLAEIRPIAKRCGLRVRAGARRGAEPSDRTHS
jgi:1,2-phenylacetyl-CoA epoxidase catalytic subunit